MSRDRSTSTTPGATTLVLRPPPGFAMAHVFVDSGEPTDVFRTLLDELCRTPSP